MIPYVIPTNSPKFVFILVGQNISILTLSLTVTTYSELFVMLQLYLPPA